jgi:hypothetical protein
VPAFGKTTGGDELEVEVLAFSLTGAVAGDVGFECGGKDGVVITVLDSTDEKL